MSRHSLMRIPDELRGIREKEFLEQKRRQRLLENSQELRQLERHLQTAYFVKSIKEQQMQLEAQRLQTKQMKKDERQLLEQQIKEHEEQLRQQELAKQLKKNAFRTTLKQQIDESLHKRQESIQELTQDRQNMQKFLERLQMEQEQEKRDIEERQQRLRMDLEDFQQKQEEYKKQQKAIDEEERLRAEAVQKQRDEELKKLEQRKTAERKQQAIVSEQLGLQLQKSEIERQKRENVMLELLEEERKKKEDYRFRQNLERQVRAREYIRLELQRFIEQRKLEKEKERRSKLAAERAEIERIMAETEKAAAFEIQRLREKEATYNFAIQQMLEERRQARASNLAAHMRDYELLRSEERKIQIEVEEERKRLLSKHPNDIFKYLPPGVLRDSDREFLSLTPKKK